MSKRHAIIEPHHLGVSNSMIIKQLKVPKSNVYDTLARFKELGDDKDHPRSGCTCTAHTPKIIKVACERIRRNPKQSIRKMAQKMNISPKTMRTNVKTDRKLLHFKLKKLHQLTDLQKKKRVDRAQVLLNFMKDSTQKGDIVFSGKKLFTVEAKFNPQNGRVVAKKRDNISEHLKTVYCQQKPASAMVWAVVSKMWKSPLIFIKQGMKLNINACIEDILIPASQAMKKHFGKKNFTFQQDSAPSHTSRKIQAWCKVNFLNFWSKKTWPPASPDLNPLDLNIWSILEAEACTETHDTIEGFEGFSKKSLGQNTTRKAPCFS